MGHDSVLFGGNSEHSKTECDTILLLGPWGSGALSNGQFQDQSGQPDWNGWTSVDYTQPTNTHWSISDYNADNLNTTPNNLAAYCGDEILSSCDELDPVGGYGNNYNESIKFLFSVEDRMADCLVTVSGIFNHNTEPGYDYTTFRFKTSNGYVVGNSLDGVGSAVEFTHSFSYSPWDYIGENYDTIHFEIKISSDGGWSDEDCSYWGNGACQVDDLRIQCSNGNYDKTTDFQDGTDLWELSTVPGFGDFADIWQGLTDYDSCHTNFSPQVAFIDDGQNWCYGPGGYIVNVTGGGSEDGWGCIRNGVESPIINWPGSEYRGSKLAFNVYRHEDLTADAPGVFYQWGVRSAASANEISHADWEDRNFVYYGGPEYLRAEQVITNLLEPDLGVIQVQLLVIDLCSSWDRDGEDGYPAPYFDNVKLTAHILSAPSMSCREIDLAQDNFTESGVEIDLLNLASNNVRFDNAQCLTSADNIFVAHGDSVTCNVTSVRSGGMIVENRL